MTGCTDCRLAATRGQVCRHVCQCGTRVGKFENERGMNRMRGEIIGISRYFYDMLGADRKVDELYGKNIILF